MNICKIIIYARHNYICIYPSCILKHIRVYISHEFHFKGILSFHLSFILSVKLDM